MNNIEIEKSRIIKRKEFKGTFFDYDMQKEDSYNLILIVVSQLLVLSFILAKDVIFSCVMVIIAIIVVLFKSWIKKKIL